MPPSWPSQMLGIPGQVEEVDYARLASPLPWIPFDPFCPPSRKLHPWHWDPCDLRSSNHWGNWGDSYLVGKEGGGEGIGDPEGPPSLICRNLHALDIGAGETDSKEVGQSYPPGRGWAGRRQCRPQPSCSSLTGHQVGLFWPRFDLFLFHTYNFQLWGHTRILPGALIFVASIPRLQLLYPTFPTVPNTYRAIPQSPSSPHLPFPSEAVLEATTCSDRWTESPAALGPVHSAHDASSASVLSTFRALGDPPIRHRALYLLSRDVASKNATRRQKGALSLLWT